MSHWPMRGVASTLDCETPSPRISSTTELAASSPQSFYFPALQTPTNSAGVCADVQTALYSRGIRIGPNSRLTAS